MNQKVGAGDTARNAVRWPRGCRHHDNAAARQTTPREHTTHPRPGHSHPIASHGGEDAHLAVVGLAQAPVPLAGDAGRHVAFLGKRALVDHQRTGVAEMRIGVGNQLPAHPASIPRRFAQHVMKSLVVAPRYGLGHLLHVAPTTLEQAVEIQARRVFDRAGEALEAGKVGREVGIEVRERGGDQRRDAIRVFELTLYSSTPR